MKIRIGEKEIDLATAISAFTTAVILLAFYSTVSMYGLFGINIIPFLEPSEIIFSTSSLFITVLIFGTNILLIQWASTINPLKPRADDVGKFKNWKKRIGQIFFILLLTICSILLLDMIGIRLSRIANIFFVFFLLSIDHPKFTFKSKITFTLFLLVGVITDGNIRHKVSIQNGHPEYLVEVKTNSYYLKSNQTFHYIGATRNFIFFWDDEKNETRVYSTSDMKWMSMRKNPDY